MTDFKIGQQVTVVITLWRSGPQITKAKITKIGRKWVSYKGETYIEGKFHIENREIYARDETSPGKVYLYLKEFLNEKRAEALFERLRQNLGYAPKKTVTSDDIIKAANLLKIDIKD